MAAFVTFEDVSKVYHSGEIEIRAVDHISFTIEKGEFCVIAVSYTHLTLPTT